MPIETQNGQELQKDIEESFKPKTNLSAKEVRDGAILTAFLESPAGQIHTNVIYDLYAEYLAEMINPETQDLAYVRLKIHALLDVAGSLGIKMSAFQQLQVQKSLAKRHIRDEFHQ